MNRISAALRRGISNVQLYYAQQKREANLRTQRRMSRAKTKCEKEIIKSNAEREKLILERKMYEAKAAVIREKELMIKARRGAGVRTVQEQFGELTGSLMKNLRTGTHKAAKSVAKYDAKRSRARRK